MFHLFKGSKLALFYKRGDSTTDSLTNLFDLNYMLQIGEDIINSQQDLALYLLDIDDFRNVNATYGYQTGNKILVELAANLKKICKDWKGNLVTGRLGGDKFIIYFVGCTEKEALTFLARLRTSLQEILFEGERELTSLKLSISVGIAYTPSALLSLEDLIQKADFNLYREKKEKINPIKVDHKYHQLLPQEAQYLLQVLAEKDMYSYVHSKYVAHYSTLLARTLQLSENEIKAIAIGAWCHDLGKIAITNSILRKRGKLDKEEYEIIKSHVVKGLDLTRTLALVEISLNCVKYHHERFDGRGYPYGITSKKTPLEAKILQIADAYAAMTVKRVYRDIMSQGEALQEIRRNLGSQFDPEIGASFLTCFNK